MEECDGHFLFVNILASSLVVDISVVLIQEQDVSAKIVQVQVSPPVFQSY